MNNDMKIAAGKCPIEAGGNCPLKSQSEPKANRKFIQILARYVPDDIIPYPEYKGKPYYSILYEENGEQFVGFGTYNIEVLSKFLQTYFLV